MIIVLWYDFLQCDKRAYFSNLIKRLIGKIFLAFSLAYGIVNHEMSDVYKKEFALCFDYAKVIYGKS